MRSARDGPLRRHRFHRPSDAAEAAVCAAQDQTTAADRRVGLTNYASTESIGRIQERTVYRFFAAGKRRGDAGRDRKGPVRAWPRISGGDQQRKDLARFEIQKLQPFEEN